MQAHRGILRPGLVALGVPQIVLGVWLLIDPRGFFDSFPGAGLHWGSAYGPFNEHYMIDVGSLFVAIGVLMVLAAWWWERRLVEAALIAYLLYQVPHLLYHVGADDALPAGEEIASPLLIGLTVLAAALMLGLTRADRPARRPIAASRDGDARISPRRSGLLARGGNWYARRRYGGAVTPGGVFAHHPRLAMGYAGFEMLLERSHRVDDRLKALAEIKAAALVNCEWCIDFGSYIAHEHGVPEDQMREMPRYRDSAAFGDVETLVLDYAVGMSRTPAAVDDELFARLREHFDDAQLVELTSAIAIENFRARFNHATGMASQGFSEGMVCVVPETGTGPAPATPV